jgi:hypothetical protein
VDQRELIGDKMDRNRGWSRNMECYNDRDVEGRAIMKDDFRVVIRGNVGYETMGQFDWRLTLRLGLFFFWHVQHNRTSILSLHLMN